MLINILGAKCVGIEAVPVTVEVDITHGIGIHLVGLADVAVKESLLRTVTALQSLGFRIPGKKIVINLAPADVRKNGSGYDLPIAIGILAASEQKRFPGLDKYLIMGELGLDGSVREVQGALPFADLVTGLGISGCILPLRSALEATECNDLSIFGVETLADVIRILEEQEDCSDLLVWNTRLYRIWLTMKSRCYLPSQVGYKYYGGQGVTVCDEWKNDFMSFHDWAMNNGYEETLTIDRIDPYGNYEPSNCRWSTYYVQEHNKRNREEAFRKGAEKRKKKVICLDTQVVYPSIKEASQETGVTAGQIVEVCKGRIKTARGMKFSYYNGDQ